MPFTKHAGPKLWSPFDLDFLKSENIDNSRFCMVVPFDLAEMAAVVGKAGHADIDCCGRPM